VKIMKTGMLINMNIDLRYKINIGESYLIDIFSNLISCNFIYRFNGEYFIMIMAHKNYTWYQSILKNKLTKKELKHIIVKLKKADKVLYLGILEKIKGD